MLRTPDALIVGYRLVELSTRVTRFNGLFCLASALKTDSLMIPLFLIDETLIALDDYDRSIQMIYEAS